MRGAANPLVSSSWSQKRKRYDDVIDLRSCADLCNLPTAWYLGWAVMVVMMVVMVVMVVVMVVMVVMAAVGVRLRLSVPGLCRARMLGDEHPAKLEYSLQQWRQLEIESNERKADPPPSSPGKTKTGQGHVPLSFRNKCCHPASRRFFPETGDARPLPPPSHSHAGK